MKLCSGAELVDGLIESAKRVAERMREVVGGINESG
jgi:GTP cyclohydrolase I